MHSAAVALFATARTHCSGSERTGAMSDEASEPAVHAEGAGAGVGDGGAPQHEDASPEEVAQLQREVAELRALVEQRRAQLQMPPVLGAAAPAAAQPLPGDISALQHELGQLRQQMADTARAPTAPEAPAGYTVLLDPPSGKNLALSAWAPTAVVWYIRTVLLAIVAAFWIWLLVTFIVGSTQGSPSPNGQPGSFTMYIVLLVASGIYILLGFCHQFRPNPLGHFVELIFAIIAFVFLGAVIFFDSNGVAQFALGTSIYRTTIVRLVGELVLVSIIAIAVLVDMVFMHEIGYNQDGIAKYRRAQEVRRALRQQERELRVRHRDAETGFGSPYGYYWPQPAGVSSKPIFTRA